MNKSCYVGNYAQNMEALQSNCKLHFRLCLTFCLVTAPLFMITTEASDMIMFHDPRGKCGLHFHNEHLFPALNVWADRVNNNIVYVFVLTV
jgi:hypothetical protein